MSIPFQDLFNITPCMKTVVIDKTWQIDAKVFNDIYAVQYVVEHTDLYAGYRVSKVTTNFVKQVVRIEIIPADYDQIKDV
jgi:hypothetical protein